MVLNGIPKIDGAALTAVAKGHPSDSLKGVCSHAAVTDRTKRYDDHLEMLDKEALDIVAICRPYSLNAEASIAAAERGIHVISEKPVATNEADLDALANAVQQNDVRLTTMLGMRLDPAIQAAQKAVADGRIGTPILATAQKSYQFGTRPDFYKRRETYGGTIPWVAIHAVDYTRWAAGLEYTWVAAHHGNLAHPDYPGCEDHGGILFRFSNGGTAMVNLDYLRPKTAPSHGDDRLRIAGSEGIVEVLNGKAHLIPADGEPCELPLGESPDFLVDFNRELNGEGTHIIGPDEAIRVTRICLKARESADSGEALDLSAL